MLSNAEHLEPGDVYGSDPLARLLDAKLHLSPLKFALSGIVFAIAYMGGLALAFGFFQPREGIVASTVDFFNQLNFFIVFPAIAFYYQWQPGKLTATYAAVREQLADGAPAGSDVFVSIRRAAGQSGWWLAGLVVALIFIGLGIPDNFLKLGRWWYAANGWMVAGLQLSRGLMAYMVVLICGRHLAASIQLGRIYKQGGVQAVILAPRQRRGIRAAADYAFSFVVFTAAFGLNIGLTPILSTKPEAAYPYLVVLYLILAPFCFLLPLWGAHRAMVTQKNRTMDALALQHQAQYERLLAQVENNGPEAEEELRRLKNIEAAYELAKRSWGWPFDTAVLLKVGAAIAAPFAVVVSQLIQEQVAGLLAGAFVP